MRLGRARSVVIAIGGLPQIHMTSQGEVVRFARHLDIGELAIPPGRLLVSERLYSDARTRLSVMVSPGAGKSKWVSVIHKKSPGAVADPCRHGIAMTRLDMCTIIVERKGQRRLTPASGCLDLDDSQDDGASDVQSEQGPIAV